MPLTFLIKIGINVVFDIVRCNVINGKLVNSTSLTSEMKNYGRKYF